MYSAIWRYIKIRSVNYSSIVENKITKWSRVFDPAAFNGEIVGIILHFQHGPRGYRDYIRQLWGIGKQVMVKQLYSVVPCAESLKLQNFLWWKRCRINKFEKGFRIFHGFFFEWNRFLHGISSGNGYCDIIWPVNLIGKHVGVYKWSMSSQYFTIFHRHWYFVISTRPIDHYQNVNGVQRCLKQFIKYILYSKPLQTGPRRGSY